MDDYRRGGRTLTFESRFGCVAKEDLRDFEREERRGSVGLREERAGTTCCCKTAKERNENDVLRTQLTKITNWSPERMKNAEKYQTDSELNETWENSVILYFNNI